MKILAQRRRPDLCAGDDIPDEVYGPGQIAEIMSRSDYIVAAAPLAVDTRKMIGPAEFAAAKTDSVFVNVGRGAVVDEDALTAALDTRLKGAALDVFAVEPLPLSSPLWTHPRVFMSPHCAGKFASWVARA